MGLKIKTGHVLITGGAGFIGSHLVERLLEEGWYVTVIDDLHPFYSIRLKNANLGIAMAHSRFKFIQGDILDPKALAACVDLSAPFDLVIHLAALAGVRPSILDPLAYHRVNASGTLAMLEFAKMQRTPHFILASSSSVYGEDPNVPWKEHDRQGVPISPYAATKLVAESYAQLYSGSFGLRITALRFFTVFGPRQRPDLAIHRFTRNILKGLPITRFGNGDTRRDYTYVGDIVNGVIGAVERTGGGQYEVYNLGNSQTVALHELIGAIEEVVGRKAIIDEQPEQSGDVPQTFADISLATKDLGYKPRTSLKVGLEQFLMWYKEMERVGTIT